MENFIKQIYPVKIPTPDGKSIEEYFGLASTQSAAYSIARMVAPPGWSEPHQNPEFDEVTIIISGRKSAEVDGEEIELGAGECLLVKKGARVKYSNPFDEPVEYWSICIPAFSVEAAHREK